ncbi:MAG: DUF3466 family protein [Solirubrobacteraceae bacterium]
MGQTQQGSSQGPGESAQQPEQIEPDEVIVSKTPVVTGGSGAPPLLLQPCYVFDESFLSLDGYPDPNGLNLGDQVCGDNTGDGETYDAWIERPLGTFVGADAPGAASSVLAKINDSGVAVGTWTDSKGLSHAYVWTAADEFVDVSAMIDGVQSWGIDINNHGVAVGTVALEPPTSNPGTYCSFIYDPQASPKITYLEGVRGFPNSSASAINDKGQVTGACYDESTDNSLPYIYSKTPQFVMPGEGVSLLPGLPNASGFDINDSGVVVGSQGFASAGAASSGMFIWSGGASTAIPLNGFAYAINNHNQVIGSAQHLNGQSFAFLYESGAVFDLNTITHQPAGSNLHFDGADDINDNGHITAWGSLPGYTGGFNVLLVPCPSVRRQPPVVTPRYKTVRSGVGGAAWRAAAKS